MYSLVWNWCERGTLLIQYTPTLLIRVNMTPLSADGNRISFCLYWEKKMTPIIFNPILLLFKCKSTWIHNLFRYIFFNRFINFVKNRWSTVFFSFFIDFLFRLHTEMFLLSSAMLFCFNHYWVIISFHYPVACLAEFRTSGWSLSCVLPTRPQGALEDMLWMFFPRCWPSLAPLSPSSSEADYQLRVA